MNDDQALIRRVQANKYPDALIESSPLAQALGGRITFVDVQSGRVDISYQPGEFFIQAEQVIQGGAVATMMDFAMAFAALAVLPDGESVATANLNVSYLRAAKAGTLRAVGELERKGRSLIFARARLIQMDDVVVATATSTLSVIVSRSR